MDFTDKVVVFVGALGAIGFETSKQIIKKNIAYFFILDVIENDGAVEKLQSMNPKCKVRYINFDITDKNCIKNTFSKIVAEAKYIDILINGAGILRESDWERTLNVNLIGLINTTYEALPYMDKSKNGRGGLIANIASIAGVEPLSAVVSYTTSKFGIVGFSRCMADPHYYKTTGVAVTVLCPGFTETSLLTVPDVYAFEYSKAISEKLKHIKKQPASICGEHFMRVIEACKNGSFWKSDCGILSEIEFKVYWTPTPK